MDTLDKHLTEASLKLAKARAAHDEVLMGYWFRELERLLDQKIDARKATRC